MKSFLLLAIIAIMMVGASCGKAAPNNQIYASDSTLIGWDHAKPVYEHTVLIKPTWGQSFHYAKQGGWGLWLTFSIILFAAFLFMCYLIATDNLPRLFENNIFRYCCLGLLLIFSLICFFGQPGSIKGNNDHWVPKAQYDHYMESQGNITPIWDSLANGCHLNWGPDKGCKK